MAQGDGCALVRAVAVVAAAAALVVLILFVIQYAHPTPPLYFANIFSVSGVGDDWGRQPLQFTLTIGVQSRSQFWRHRACLERGTVVEVAYHAVELVYATTGSWELCAVAREVGTVQRLMITMARSNNASGLPELVAEGLAADVRRGIQAFDVTFWIPSTGQDGDHGKLVSCMGKIVGDNSLTNACDVHYTK